MASVNRLASFAADATRNIVVGRFPPIDASYIFSNHTEKKRVQTDSKQNEDGGRCEAFRPFRSEQQPSEKIEDTCQRGHERDQKSSKRRHSERRRGMCNKAVDRQADQLDERKFALALFADGSLIRNAGLVGRQERCQAAGIWRRIVDAVELIEDAAIDKTEVAAVEHQIVARDLLEQPIVEFPTPLQHDVFIAKAPNADHDVMTLVP